jgi:hypothetical protein
MAVALTPFPASARVTGSVYRVDFESPRGRRWWAIGGGAGVDDAIASAREALPDGAWRVVKIRPLYGD